LEFHGWQYPIHPSKPGHNEKLFLAFSQLAKSKKQANKEKLACWGDFEGRLLLAVHPDTPVELLKMVMFQAGQAQYAEMVFMLSSSSPLAQQKKKNTVSTEKKSLNKHPTTPASTDEAEACASNPVLHFSAELGMLECQNHIGIQIHDKNKLSIYRFESTEEDLKDDSKAVHAVIPPKGNAIDRKAIVQWLHKTDTARAKEKYLLRLLTKSKTTARTLLELLSITNRVHLIDQIQIFNAEKKHPASMNSRSLATDSGARQRIQAQESVAVIPVALPAISHRPFVCKDSKGRVWPF